MKSEAALYLLDKNVARRCVKGIAGLMEMRRLTSEEHLALQFLKIDRRLAPRLFITPQSYNILTFHFSNRPETHIISTILTRTNYKIMATLGAETIQLLISCLFKLLIL